MGILFINGSPNKEGNTARLAEKLLVGKEYKSLHLVDYRLYSYGQKFEDDQFAEIVDAMEKAEVIVIGSPVYWHNMSGSVSQGALSGKKFVFLFQGGQRRKSGCWKKRNIQ